LWKTTTFLYENKQIEEKPSGNVYMCHGAEIAE